MKTVILSFSIILSAICLSGVIFLLGEKYLLHTGIDNCASNATNTFTTETDTQASTITDWNQELFTTCLKLKGLQAK